MLDDTHYMQENETGKTDVESQNLFLFCLIFIIIWLHQVLAVVHGIFSPDLQDL